MRSSTTSSGACPGIVGRLYRHFNATHTTEPHFDLFLGHYIEVRLAKCVFSLHFWVWLQMHTSISSGIFVILSHPILHTCFPLFICLHLIQLLHTLFRSCTSCHIIQYLCLYMEARRAADTWLQASSSLGHPSDWGLTLTLPSRSPPVAHFPILATQSICMYSISGLSLTYAS